VNSSMDLDVVTRRLDATTAIVTMAGEMDLYSTPKAREAVSALLDDGCSRLIFNLAGTQYLDSTALGMLKGTLEHVRQRQGALRLVAPPARVRRMLEITGLVEVFPIDESEQDAIANLAGEGKDVP
jgi:anti-sigma B factor antagonist